MELNIVKVAAACDTLAHRIIAVGDEQHSERHGSPWLFDKCMRAFDCKLPAEAITISVFINAPVMQWGEATIDRGGNLTMHTI